MRDMINVAFQQAWFGPFSIPQRTQHRCKKIIGPMGEPVFEDPKCYEHAGVVYDVGPFDGLMTTSMWAQQMAQIPVVNWAQARPRMAGPDVPTPNPCRIGTRPWTNPDGTITCKEWHAPSGMLGPNPVEVENKQASTNQITYPVRAFYGWEKRGL